MGLLWIPILPLLGSLAPILAARWQRSALTLATAFLPALALLLLLQQAPAVFSGQVITAGFSWIPLAGLDVSFRLDGLAWLFAFLILAIGQLVIIYARYYLSKRDNLAQFFAYLMLFMTAMLGIVLSGNLIQLWFFWELTSVSSFLLIGYWSHQSAARKGARMALAITGGGGLALLAGLLLVGKVVGSYDLSLVLASGDLIREHRLYPVILALVLLGAFTKSAQFPFHFWLPHAMSAPTPVSAYLHSATMVKAGIFLLARMYPVLAGTEAWFVVVSLVGLTTLLLGAYIALFKHDIKALLAYSTVSHLGLITLLLGLNTQLSTVAAIFHIMNHAAFKAALFMTAGIIDHQTGTRDMRQISGLWQYMPQTAVLVMFAAASMAGLPLLNGFLSKEMFYAETLQQTTLGSLSWMIPFLATLGTVFSVAYSIRLVDDVFFNAPGNFPKQPKEPSRFMHLPVLILVLVCVLVGLFPSQTVGPLLALASANALGGNLPTYHLAIWHGFNLPLLMSALAVLGGLIIYQQRKHLFRFQARFPEPDAKFIFEAAMQKLIRTATKIMHSLENDSLQRYVYLLILFAAILMFEPLLDLTNNQGNRQHVPMDLLTLVGVAILSIGAVATVLFSRHRLIALICLSIVGLMVSLAFVRFSAPDLALTQLSVEVVTVILLLLALFFLPQHTHKESHPRRLVRDLSLAGLIGGLIGTINYALITRPFESISSYYLENSLSGGGGTNVVNVILVDFRGLDTMGEISVLGIAALGIFKLIVRMRLYLPSRDSTGRAWNYDFHPMILRTVSQSLLPVALLISFYIFLRGHNMPGGGFIAGLITSIAIIQQYIANGVDWVKNRMHLNYQWFVGGGIVTAASTGLGSWFFQRPFLTSWFDHLEIPLLGSLELSSALIFDLGVYLTVVGATLMILTNLGKLNTNYSPTLSNAEIGRSKN